ncbi:hypothetical protein TWF696_001287 [Orbilia brochopaga]|uniref:Uncharacterized protein n=1 Tax=Orbilia brochopaga TaxID=3140254 RepID=A0AAV9UC68_9PEZI
MFGAKTLLNVGFALLGLLILAPIGDVFGRVIDKDRGITVDEHGNKWVHIGNGEVLPLGDLTVTGEYYPGGPTFNLTGSSLQAIIREVQKSPLWNETAWQTSTESENVGTLQKKANQITYCEREQEGSELGIIPDDAQYAINYLVGAAWHRAFCYADRYKCAPLACHNGAAVILCSHRPETVRVYCGDVAGQIAQEVVNAMVRDRNQAIPNFNFWEPCAGWWIPPKFYTGYSVWSDDPTWDIRVHKWPGISCSA